MTVFKTIHKGLVDTPREGYLKRGVLPEECESIWLHGKRATK